jgi:hypothetical protein
VAAGRATQENRIVPYVTEYRLLNRSRSTQDLTCQWIEDRRRQHPTAPVRLPNVPGRFLNDRRVNALLNEARA